MLISCSACNSKYLINSADIKPNGRNVKCARCGHKWFQEPLSIADENEKKTDFPKVNQGSQNNKNSDSVNLPSTYVKKNQTSILNSFLVLFLLIVFFFSIIFFRSNSSNIIVLLNYYVLEFYFNLKLIIGDLAVITHKIIN